MSILSSISNENINQTEVDKNISDFILKDLPNILNWSPSYIAQRAFVSKPSITRYCQKLGFKGFNDFFIHLKLESLELQNKFKLETYNYKDRIKIFQNDLTKSIFLVQNLINEINFNKINEIISTKRRIIFLAESKWENQIRKILKTKILSKSNIFVFNWADLSKNDLYGFGVDDAIINFCIENYDVKYFEKTKLLIDKQNISLINIVENGHLWFEDNYKTISINIPFFENDDDNFFKEMFMLYLIKAIKIIM